MSGRPKPPRAVGSSAPAWWRAACRSHDPELFFSDDPATITAAKAVCRACPIRAGCLAHAIATASNASLNLHGIWGGTTPAEREPMLRRRKKCGTNGGFILHKQRGESVCPACRRARHVWTSNKPQYRATRAAAKRRRRDEAKAATADKVVA